VLCKRLPRRPDAERRCKAITHPCPPLHARQGMAVGAVSPTIDSALVIGPAVMLVFLVFGGLYTTDADVPKVLRWIPKCSVINRGYEGLTCNEFKGLVFKDEGPSSVLKGATP